jgi:hypothetical protein
VASGQLSVAKLMTDCWPFLFAGLAKKKPTTTRIPAHLPKLRFTQAMLLRQMSCILLSGTNLVRTIDMNIQSLDQSDDRDNDERRIISAWRSEAYERRAYWQNVTA